MVGLHLIIDYRVKELRVNELCVFLYSYICTNRFFLGCVVHLQVYLVGLNTPLIITFKG